MIYDLSNHCTDNNKSSLSATCTTHLYTLEERRRQHMKLVPLDVDALQCRAALQG